jgi:serine/threonine protein kinase
MPDPFDRLRSALADRYAIERELGSGGMATVYLALDLKHERQVAVKVLRAELANSLGAGRFLREVKITANLSHPNILPLLDSGEADGFLYYVMPYVKGESLRDRLNRERQLSVVEAVKITGEVADALGSAHQHDVIHRDIKPENILIEEGHAVVADFGVARAVSAAGEARLTETGIAVGTPVYMSPEQASGEAQLDGRSDIYSLGCVLYEMLSGEPPYMGPTPQAVIAKKLSEPTPRIAVVRELVPQSVAAALDRALAKTPADRFDTPGEFVAALSAAPEVISPPTANAEAYQLYLQGHEYFRRPGLLRENLESAQQLYERALALDPEFALAYADLSDVHSEMHWSRYDPSAERVAQQREAAEAALRLAPELPRAHHVMGVWHYRGERDYARALVEYDLAARGMPNDPYIWFDMGAVHRRLSI